jgi:hypothetical protein
MRRWGALPIAIVGPSIALLLLVGAAVGQEATGTISGTVRSGTAGAPPVDGAQVELITLADGGALTVQATATRDGRFEFEVPLDASLTHLLRAMHQGVQYFATTPVLVSAGLPTAEREITVYDVTAEQPDLRIESTRLVLVALDRTNAQLTIEREDLVVNPGDRTYAGDELGITLRLPAPDGVVEGELVSAGIVGDGTSSLDGGLLAVLTPLRPGTTLVVTRHVVGYDRDRDAYGLRATAPLPTGRLELYIPARFVGGVRLLGDAVRGEDDEFEGERLLVIEHPGGATSGRSVAAELEGLAGRMAANPLTGRGGAVVATVLALVVLVGGVAAGRLFTGRRGRRGGQA